MVLCFRFGACLIAFFLVEVHEIQSEAFATHLKWAGIQFTTLKDWWRNGDGSGGGGNDNIDRQNKQNIEM